MRIQIKAARRGRGVVFIHRREMYPCVDGDDAWETLGELYQQAPQGGRGRAVEGATWLTIRERRGLLLMTDARGELFECENEEDLWEALQEILADAPEEVSGSGRRTFPSRGGSKKSARKARPKERAKVVPPREESKAIARRRASAPPMQVERVVEPQVISAQEAEEEIQSVHDPSREEETEVETPGLFHKIIADEIGESGAQLATNLARKLIPTMRKVSHRGPAPKPGSKRPKKRVKRGDIY